MIDAIALGRMIAEDIANTPGPCLYPGKFHPPHEGHFKAANVLASKPYVTEVIIILSAKVSPETGNITPEDAMQIWQVYLKAQPNDKIKLQISEHNSPVVDMIDIIKRNPKAPVIYIAGGDDEADDQHYLESLSRMFPGKIKAISVHEKDGDITAPHVRAVVQQRDAGDDTIPDEFKDTIPVAAANKGAIPKIWSKLTSRIPSDKGQGIN